VDAIIGDIVRQLGLDPSLSDALERSRS
jgi:hypothetical protein